MKNKITTMLVTTVAAKAVLYTQRLIHSSIPFSVAIANDAYSIQVASGWVYAAKLELDGIATQAALEQIR
jgi:hypothetical protein